jgi:hypothetical protein
MRHTRRASVRSHARVAPLVAVGLIVGGSLVPAQGQQGNAVAPPAARDSRATPTGTAVIAGVVVAADTGRPVRRVRLTLSSTAPDVSLSATTADDGHFKFTELPAGAFTLAASRPGFIDSIFGQRTPGSGRPGTPVQLIDGQKVESLSMPIARGGVITGMVADDRGDPEFGAQVRAMRWVLRSGERTLTVAATATTDDRGIYRATGLLPGDYLVSATSPEGPSSDLLVADAKKRLAEVSAMGTSAAASAVADLKATIATLVDSTDPSKDAPTGYAPVYYPGTTLAAAAQTVTLGVSEERQAVNVSLQLVPLTRVSGVVTGAAGTAGSVLVVLTATGTPAPLPGPRTARLGPDGRFSFSAVPPGSYTVMAFTMRDSAVAAKIAADKLAAALPKSQTVPDVPSFWAATDVVVDDRSMAPITLGLQPALAVSGRFALSGSSAPPDFSRMRVLLSAASSASPERSVPVPPAAADVNGRFSVAGLVPGRYRLSVAGTAGPWSIASAVIGGRDVMDAPLEVRSGDDLAGLVVTLTDRTTWLLGTLQDASGRVTSDFTVVVFPFDAAYWLPQARRIQAARPSTDGHYGFRGLPPGEYRVAVVPDVEPGQWYDPNWLRQVLPSAVAITLGDGERHLQDLRVGR